MAEHINDAKIAELTGIWPDARYRIPLTETRELVRGVQRGDSVAAESLIATRMHWMLETYAQQNTAKSRTDLAPADILYIGGLATVRAAERVDSSAPQLNSIVQIRARDLMTEMLTTGDGLYDIPRPITALMNRGKLLPSTNPDGDMPLYDPHHAASDWLVPYGDASDMEPLLDRSDMPMTPEELVVDFGSTITAADLSMLLSLVVKEERSLINMRYGIGGEEARTQREIADLLGTSHQNAQQRIGRALRKLRRNYDRIRRPLDIEDHAENAQPQESQPESTQNALEMKARREHWLGEIAKRKAQEKAELDEWLRGLFD